MNIYFHGRFKSFLRKKYDCDLFSSINSDDDLNSDDERCLKKG